MQRSTWLLYQLGSVRASLTRTGNGDFTVLSGTNHLDALVFSGGDGRQGNTFGANNAFGDENGSLTIKSSKQIPGFTGGVFDATVDPDSAVNGTPFAAFLSGETVFNNRFGLVSGLVCCASPVRKLSGDRPQLGLARPFHWANGPGRFSQPARRFQACSRGAS